MLFTVTHPVLVFRSSIAAQRIEIGCIDDIGVMIRLPLLSTSIRAHGNTSHNVDATCSCSSTCAATASWRRTLGRNIRCKVLDNDN
jgi:hypothetical protein